MGITFLIIEFSHGHRDRDIYWLPVYIRAVDEAKTERLKKLIIASVQNHQFIEFIRLVDITPFVSNGNLIETLNKNYLDDIKKLPAEELGIRIRLHQLSLGIKDNCALIELLETTQVDVPDNPATLGVMPLSLESITTGGIRVPVYRVLGHGTLTTTVSLEIWWS